MHTLSKLICDVALAETANFSGVRDIAIFLDPHGELTEFAVQHLRKNPASRLFIGSRDVLQTFAALDIADAAGVEDRVFAAGYETEIQLDIFFADARAGFNGRIMPAEIDVVLSELPKSLAELRYFVRSLREVALWENTAGEELGSVAAANFATKNLQPENDPKQRGIVFIAGGNNKHMTPQQNGVLGEVFADVHASRGKGKFRCLIGREILADAPAYQPLKGEFTLPGFTQNAVLFGVGGVFSGAKADRGGEFLATHAISDLLALFGKASSVKANKREQQARQHEFTMLDFGCGNGLISRAFADVFSRVKIYDTDISADAITATHLTMLSEILDRRAFISWDDAAHSITDDSIDVVLLNPPFHQGTEIDPTLVQHLLDAAQAKLHQGGIIYFVHNSHLRYRPELEKRFVNVVELARNSKFTVLRAAK